MPAPTAVLLDALGTLVQLELPWPLLIETLRGRHGIEVGWEDAKRAVIAEMTYYKQHHDEGRDDESLAELRSRCAGVLRDNLPQVKELPEQALVDALIECLRFAAYPDVPGALAELRQMGLRLAVVSNWDCSLPDTLAQLGLAGLVDAIVVSAEVGARKPEPLIFRAALERVGAQPASALMVGDSPETDVEGARAAGIRPLLLDRGGIAADNGRMDRIFTLTDLPPLIDRALP